MRTFVCRYATPTGTIETEQRHASSAAALRAEIEVRGCYVLSVAPASRLVLPRLPALGRRVPPGDLLVVTQELHALVRAGLPILQSLDVLERRCANRHLGQALAAVREDVRGGLALSDAAARRPREFPSLLVASLRAGEQSGNLVQCLASYVALLKRTLAVRRRLGSALVYPAILCVLSAGVVGFLLAYVVPTFSRVYADLRAALPAPTQLLVEVTAALRAAALPLGALGVLAAAAAAAWVRTPAGRLAADAALLRLPVVGDLLARHAAALFCRTLATVLAGGIPIVQALDTATGAVGNAALRARIVHEVPAVSAGRPLAAALEASGALPPTAVEMIAVGESSGGLHEMLGHVADFFDEELDVRLQRFTATLEPMIMVVMGLFVGTLVVVLYLPIFDLSRVLR